MRAGLYRTCEGKELSHDNQQTQIRFAVRSRYWRIDWRDGFRGMLFRYCGVWRLKWVFHTVRHKQFLITMRASHRTTVAIFSSKCCLHFSRSEFGSNSKRGGNFVVEETMRQWSPASFGMTSQIEEGVGNTLHGERSLITLACANIQELDLCFRRRRAVPAMHILLMSQNYETSHS